MGTRFVASDEAPAHQHWKSKITGAQETDTFYSSLFDVGWPDAPHRTLRNLTRYRKTQIAERQREANRLHKALEDTGIKLDCVASDILGKSGRAMLDALVAGTTDPQVLAELAKGRLRTKIPSLREALQLGQSRYARSSPRSERRWRAVLSRCTRC